MAKNESQKKKSKSWFNRRNLLDTIAVFGLILGALNTCYQWFPPPQRARLTIFIEHYNIWQGSANELEVDIWGKIVNDSPLTASIKEWDLFIALNMSYKTLFSSFNFDPKGLTISQSEELNFTMGKTLIGENDTRLPETAVKSCVATIWYKDDIGIQIAKEELRFIS